MDISVEYCLFVTALGILSIFAAVTPGGNIDEAIANCELIEIQECYGIGYDHTMLNNKGGNKFGHTTQDQVRNDPLFQEFMKMLEKHANCSIDFRLFVCGMFLPRCINSKSMIPCKSTCIRVKDRCSFIAENEYKFDWPTEMECENQPYFVDHYDACMISVEDPTKDKPIMVMDIPKEPDTGSLRTDPWLVKFANCQCTCTQPPPPPPCDRDAP